LQNRIKQVINTLKKEWDITLLVVLDGLIPKFVSDKQTNILSKSLNIWDQLRLTNEQGTNEDLFMALLDTYGSRCFLAEVINACLETNTDFFIAPYQSTP